MRVMSLSKIFAAVLSLSMLAAGSGVAHEYQAGEIEIGHPWSRATPPGAQVAAGYLDLKNKGDATDRLLSVTAEISARAEVHEMAVGTDGVMTMRPLAEGLELPAGGEISLKPGGYHIMFLDLQGPVKEGQRFKGTLTFEKAGAIDVEFAVEAMGARQEQEEGGHQGH